MDDERRPLFARPRRVDPSESADLLKALRYAGDEFGEVISGRTGDVTPPSPPEGNRRQRRKAAALARRGIGR